MGTPDDLDPSRNGCDIDADHRHRRGARLVTCAILRGLGARTGREETR